MERTIRIDPSTCDGFGFCAEILNEIISLDEWGFPIVRDVAIPDELMQAAQQAVKFCPRRSIAIVETTVELSRHRRSNQSAKQSINKDSAPIGQKISA